MKGTKELPGNLIIHFPKMLALAFDGITSLSVKPIRLIAGFGLGVSALSFIGIIWAVVATILGRTVAGWSSTVCIVCVLWEEYS